MCNDRVLADAPYIHSQAFPSLPSRRSLQILQEFPHLQKSSKNFSRNSSKYWATSMEASFGLSIGGIDPGGIITHPLCTQVFFQTAGFFTNDVTCQHCYDTGTARCFLFGCIWPEKASYLAGHISELYVWFSTKRYLCVSIQHCGHAIMIYCEILYQNILKCAWYWVLLGIIGRQVHS